MTARKPANFAEMVDAASAGDWSRFAELEHEYLRSQLPRNWQDREDEK